MDLQKGAGTEIEPIPAIQQADALRKLIYFLYIVFLLPGGHKEMSSILADL